MHPVTVSSNGIKLLIEEHPERAGLLDALAALDRARSILDDHGCERSATLAAAARSAGADEIIELLY